MTTAANAVAFQQSDATRFEVRDGNHRISCTVLDDALEAVSGLTPPSTPASRRTSFDRFRTLIDAAAKMKHRAQQSGATGPLVITRDDLRRVPPTHGVPSFGSHQRSGTRPATVAGLQPAAEVASAHAAPPRDDEHR